MGPWHKPIEIRRWVATTLPIHDASVDKQVSNLPFGERIGAHAENRGHYSKLLTEFVQVVRPGGRLPLLTGERASMRQAMSRRQSRRARETYDALLLGPPETIYVPDRGAV